jgi:hypothetical protein
MDAQTRGLGDGAQERAATALAVGAGDVDHRRQMEMRITQIGEQPDQAVEAQVDQSGVEFLQPVEAGVVTAQAAAF